MLRKFFTLYLIVFTFPIFSQTVSVKSENGANVQSAHIFVTPLSGNKKTTYHLTNVSGEVRLNIEEASRITINLMGFKQKADTIYPGKNYSYILENDPLQLTDHVVTSSFVPVKLEENVFKVKIIERERIDNQGAMNLRDLLAYDLNFRQSMDPQLGSSLKMMGVGAENIKIMIDGVPVIGRMDGAVDLSQINLNNVERVEIVEGPSSVSYGSNALGGVINLITKKTQSHTVEGSLFGFYESVGNYNVDANVGWKFGKSQLQVSGGRYFFDGYNTTDSIKRVMTWKPKEQYFAELQFSHRFKGLSLRYAGNFFYETLQSKGAPIAPFDTSARDSYFKTLRFSHSLFLNGFVKKDHHLDFTASYSYYNRVSETYLKDLVRLEQVLLPSTVNTDFFQGIMSRGIYSFTREKAIVNVQAGYDINVETAEGQRILDTKQWMGDFAAFATADFNIFKKALIIKPGVRYGYNTKYTAPVTPSIHIKATPVKGFDIRASYARGFRAPSLKELFLNFVDINHNIVPNPDLDAEKSHNINLNFSYGGRKNDFSYSLTFSQFYNDIHNRISLVGLSTANPDSMVYTNRNVDRFKSMGLNFLTEFGYKEFNIGAGVSYTGVMYGLQDTANYVESFKFYPEVQTRASYFFKWWNGRLNVFFKYSGKQPMLMTDANGDVVEGFINGFPALDISYVQNLFKNRLQIAIYGKNLFDVRNVTQTTGASSGGTHTTSSSSLPTMWGRTIAVSLRYNFIVNKTPKAKKVFKD